MANTITILALSDIHGKESSLRSILESSLNSYRIDAISISGDITHFGSSEDLKKILGIISEAGRPFFYVLGNCDPPEFKTGINSLGICLEANCHKIGEVAFVGSGGSTPTPFETPFEVEEDTLIRNISGAHSKCGCSITYLVTHNPPLGSVVDLTRGGTHVGSKALRDLILNLSPRVFQCGHIHEARGKETIGKTLVFNPGPAMRGNYAIVTISGENVDVQHWTA
ncbi:MAG: metallophosphoesterase family protein [Candidatus Methanomethyliales bacterium]|nr:metallophosphoesterase family protein [Candidatus Methanomethylicales archaeon]